MLHNELEDRKAIDRLTGRFFRCFHQTGHSATGLDDIYKLCIAQAVIIKSAHPHTEIYDLTRFIEPRKQLLNDGSLENFKEYEIGGQTVCFGGIAQRLSLYEKSGRLNGIDFKTQGVKTLQFIRCNNEWKISSVTWTDESEELPIPQSLRDSLLPTPP